MEVRSGFRSGAEIAAERYDFDEYQQLASRTAHGIADPEERIENTLLGLISELGEICEPIKHARFHGHALDRENLREEIGDSLWYLAARCSESGLALSTVAGMRSMLTFQRVRGGPKAHPPAWNAWKLRTQLVFALCGRVAGLVSLGTTPALPIEESRRYLTALAQLSSSFDIELADAASTNIEKLRKRYPDGFSRERSQNRTEGRL
nr:nucleoside triphosphate pyrophosphohydrolase family protein [Ferrimicrobium acidiphilum]